MGKGNFILGTGSSSIGDVTFARRNGQQIARVRIRKIKNPKSQGQAEQRMISAEVVKFYSPLSKVLETSFEGLSKADSYAKFLSINMNLAKANGYAVPKGSGFVALPFQIAGGNMPAPSVVAGNEDDGFIGLLTDPTKAGTDYTIGEISTALIAEYGLQNGDQVTFITHGDKGLSYTRIFIDTTSSVALTEEFEVDKKGTNHILAYLGKSIGIYAAAVIFSRWDNNNQKWSRSNSFMVCAAAYLANYTGAENLAAAIASYMKSAGATPVSDVYLNGSDD